MATRSNYDYKTRRDSVIRLLLTLGGLTTDAEPGAAVMPGDFSGTFTDVVLPHDRYIVDGKTLPGTWTVKVYTTEDRRIPGRRHGRRHRAFAVCPTCNREIPTGRIHQHMGGKSCKVG